MSLPENTSLTDSELAELDEFLLADDEASRLPIDEAHGFLTALIVANKPVAQSEWLVEIWGEPDIPDDERSRMSVLIQRLYDEILVNLTSRQLFEPMVIEEEDEGEIIEVYEGWCFGFMLGVAYQPELWEQLPKHEQDLLAPLATLACLRTDEPDDLDEEEYASCAELLPGSVASLYTYWHTK